MARVGEKFPLECPACGGDIRLISLHQSRGRFGRFSPTSANRSNRLPSLPLAGRPPNGTNLSRCMTMAMSFRRHLTSCPRSTFTASESCPTRGHHEAARWPDSERLCADGKKNATSGGNAGDPGTVFWAGASPGGGSNRLTSHSSVGQRLRKCH